MKNCIAFVVLTGLVIVQGSSYSELWDHPMTPEIGLNDIMNSLKDLGKIIVNSELKVPHPVDDAGKIGDIIVTIAKLPWNNVKDLINEIPMHVSVENDLKGSVRCHNFICNIYLLGLNITMGYDVANRGLYLYIEFLGFTILHEQLPSLLYCEPVELPKHHVKVCIHADNVQLSDKRACLNLGFTFLGYSHTFPDICLHG